MNDIVDAISRINSLCQSVGVASPVPQGAFVAALAQASGNVSAAPQTATAAPMAPSAATSPGGASAGLGRVQMPAIGPVTSPFGARRNPLTGAPEFHQGIDIGAPAGAPIRAAAAGTVTYAGPMSGYGNVVVITHPDGMQTQYSHQSRISVSVGQPVTAGEVVGAVGATGEATGPHLDFKVILNGKAVDPAPYLGLTGSSAGSAAQGA